MKKLNSYFKTYVQKNTAPNEIQPPPLKFQKTPAPWNYSSPISSYAPP